MATWESIHLNIEKDWKVKFSIVMNDIKHAVVFWGLVEDDEEITGPFRWPGFVSRPVIRIQPWPVPNTNDWPSLVGRTCTTDW